MFENPRVFSYTCFRTRTYGTLSHGTRYTHSRAQGGGSAPGHRSKFLNFKKISRAHGTLSGIDYPVKVTPKIESCARQWWTSLYITVSVDTCLDKR